MKNKLAFTLAEALIAMTIIGIIAAITTPIVRHATFKKENPAKIKKFYIAMSNAVSEAEQDLGKFSYEWTYTSDVNNFHSYYLEPYLSGGKKQEGGYYLIDGSNYTITYNSSKQCMEFIYDLNGAQKPNKLGVDQFAFLLCTKTNAKKNGHQGFSTYNLSGSPTITRANLVKLCAKTSGDDPKYCSRLLQNDGWEYKSDYPWMK